MCWWERQTYCTLTQREYIFSNQGSSVIAFMLCKMMSVIFNCTISPWILILNTSETAKQWNPQQLIDPHNKKALANLSTDDWWWNNVKCKGSVKHKYPCTNDDVRRDILCTLLCSSLDMLLIKLPQTVGLYLNNVKSVSLTPHTVEWQCKNRTFDVLNEPLTAFPCNISIKQTVLFSQCIWS